MMTFPLPDYGYRSVYRSFSGMTLEQTARCPNKCVFCAKAKVGHPNVTMSLDDLDFVLKLLPNFSGRVTLSGTGDALLVDDLPERVGRIKAAWPQSRPDFVTTLTWRRDKAFFYDVFAAGLEAIRVSCYGHTAEDHKKLHGTPLFSVVQENLCALGQLPRSMTEKVILQKFSNARELGIRDVEKKEDAFFSFVRQQGIEHIKAIDCYPWNSQTTPDGHALWDSPSPCTAVWGTRAGELTIHANLDVVPCCLMFGKDMVLGNLRTHTLEEIFSGEKYRLFYDKWWHMQPGDLPYCNTCQLFPKGASRDELARMAAWQARELRGQKVIFWGAGASYRAYKVFFADCEPVAMLLDVETQGQEFIDGIPVYHPDKFLSALTEPLPLVIFAMQKASPQILQTLKEKYAFYKPAKLVICPANANIVPPVEPFFQE